MEKQCIGIDVSKDNLDCCFGQSDSSQKQKFGKSKRFKNSKTGFLELLKWTKQQKGSGGLVFVMEATGVYYENLAFFLSEHGCKLSVLLPNTVKYYSKSLNVKTKTDQIDAEILSKMGLERKLMNWEMPTKIMRDLKFLSREYREVKFKINQIKNQIHARKHSHDCPLSIKKRMDKLLVLLEKQVLEIVKELTALAKTDAEFYEKIEKVCTIPGVSFITVITIIAETNAFCLINNAKQLTSYSGLDIMQNQSGNKQGKTRISKKGNSFIRHALYMPSLNAARFNPELKKFYEKLVERKPAKKIALTAVSRKLLILTYILWKNDTQFDLNYEENKNVDRVTPAYAG